MAEEQDDSQKTEEPTERKLQQAREKGQIAKSQEVNHWFIILAFGLMLAIFAPYTAQGIADALYPFIAKAHSLPATGGGLGDLLIETFLGIAAALALPILVTILAALAAGFLQTGFLVTAEQLKPKLEKISLIKGAKRLFSLRSIMEFAKGILKLTIVATVIFLLVWPERDRIPRMTELGVVELLETLRWLGLKVIVAVLSVMTVVATLDFAFQKYQHHKQMRMSRQEVKDEYKQTEGDPQVKQRLRQLRMEKSRKRMMSAVPEADVVVANPTHYALALTYRHGEMAAPKVVAKGTDLVAQRIREIAEENDVPVVENPPLARALHASVEIDQEIPPEHFKAVAEIIGYVMRLKGKMPGGAARP
ncbi:flagellar biosynthesis protein FlhB [Ferruginivarius sediminum]|uniref:Flagellar biosynthetic protein FlhB n=1 Tax=Ferruginivarius sediminum TaxID=2661937 RepID=A0A369TD53_9PROT|nr:flagellar biosynthesis protein FlhB [Ferruginivarius sediminum]RDD60846.1 flagellar biosynthesis protein FlhB [Ferruginivarius sediminum]